MGFFKDFKDDFSDAVDELVPTGEEKDTAKDDDMINTLTENVDVEGELSKLDGLLEKASQKVEEDTAKPTFSNVSLSASPVMEVQKTNETGGYSNMEDYSRTVVPAPAQVPASDENATITAGMTISGDIDTVGSVEVQGRINGNVRCNGKLTVTGMIQGNSQASEIFLDSSRIDGEVNSTGTVKIGAGSVVIGNITATSAVVAGAVKGDIDVQGPVVIDTSAVVMGNVKSRSVQINNGAVIEGFCTQAYSEVDISSVFGTN